MPRPIKRTELIRRLRRFGWEGPLQKGKHPFMVKDSLRLTLPNPHRGDVDWSLTKRILAQAGISPDEWEQFGHVTPVFQPARFCGGGTTRRLESRRYHSPKTLSQFDVERARFD